MNKKFSFQSRLKSFVYAFRGLGIFFRTQPNAWIHLTAAITVVAAGFYFGLKREEWTIISICIGAVFAAEIFNTAIEFLVDKISPGYDEKAGQIKDLSAAAVLVISICAAITGLVIFIPYFSRLF